MPDSLNYVRETSKAIGLKMPEDREAAVVEAIEAAFRQVEEIRQTRTPQPTPSAFDAGWSTKK